MPLSNKDMLKKLDINWPFCVCICGGIFCHCFFWVDFLSFSHSEDYPCSFLNSMNVMSCRYSPAKRKWIVISSQLIITALQTTWGLWINDLSQGLIKILLSTGKAGVISLSVSCLLSSHLLNFPMKEIRTCSPHQHHLLGNGAGASQGKRRVFCEVDVKQEMLFPKKAWSSGPWPHGLHLGIFQRSDWIKLWATWSDLMAHPALAGTWTRDHLEVPSSLNYPKIL